jgi:4-hydroxy-3-methylbut-2-enyl diphosphate reductase
MIKEIVAVAPRGFCAGVARSINVVKDCLNVFGAPVYIKHAIVHNRTIVDDLERMGAVTVECVADIPDRAVAVFSAHGSPPEDFDAAQERGITVIDATCPLVTKVHMEMHRFLKLGYRVVYIGHKGHVEGLGVVGEAKKYGVDVPIIASVEDVDDIECTDDQKIAYLTQTTLSISETNEIIDALKRRCDNVIAPPTQDICYATTNRQEAIRALAQETDVIIVVGSQTSSNSNRLREVAQEHGCDASLIDSVEEIKEEWLDGKNILGVSAGASAPEHKVKEIIDHFIQKGAVLRDMQVTKENMRFTEPIALTRAKQNYHKGVV